MPKLLTSPRKPTARKRKAPKSKDYNLPHSPWQKLCDTARLKYGLSFKDLADAMKDGNRGTIWVWFHNKNGYPSKDSFTAARAASLYASLRLDPKVASAALDESRRLYTDPEEPAPQKTIDSFAEFIETVERIQHVRVYKTTILNIARRIHAGLKPANPGHPEWPDSREPGAAKGRGRPPAPRPPRGK